MKKILIRLCYVALGVFMIAIFYMGVRDTMYFHSDAYINAHKPVVKPADTHFATQMQIVDSMDRVILTTKQKGDSAATTILMQATDSEARAEIIHRAKSQNQIKGAGHKHHHRVNKHHHEKRKK